MISVSCFIATALPVTVNVLEIALPFLSVALMTILLIPGLSEMEEMNNPSSSILVTGLPLILTVAMPEGSLALPINSILELSPTI